MIRIYLSSIETDKLEILKNIQITIPYYFNLHLRIRAENFRKLYPFYRFAIGDKDSVLTLISEDGG